MRLGPFIAMYYPGTHVLMLAVRWSSQSIPYCDYHHIAVHITAKPGRSFKKLTFVNVWT